MHIFYKVNLGCTNKSIQEIDQEVKVEHTHLLHILTPHLPLTGGITSLTLEETEALTNSRTQTGVSQLIEQVLIQQVLLAGEELLSLYLVQVDPRVQEVVVLSPGLQDLKPDAGYVTECIGSEKFLVW